jgi:toxin ParE1/3/4
MAKAHLSSLAHRDLWENAEFISRDKPEAAYAWADSIEKACQRLAENPDMEEQRKSTKHGACRCFTVGNFAIFFRGVTDGVEIIRIVRGAQDIERL